MSTNSCRVFWVGLVQKHEKLHYEYVKYVQQQFVYLIMAYVETVVDDTDFKGEYCIKWLNEFSVTKLKTVFVENFSAKKNS